MAGVLFGIERILREANIDVRDLHSFVHGSTIATNAWLSRRGGRIAFLVTDGFRDVLEIGNQRRPKLYSLTQTRAAPLVPRSQVIEVRERIDAFGAVVLPIAAEELKRIAGVIAALAPDAVAISLLFSFVNAMHEKELADYLAAAMPGTPIYRSSEINPQIEEYVRANTTAAAAYVGPIVDRYVAQLETGLHSLGFASPLMLMRSDGGVATTRAMRRNPGPMLLSGPAGGVVAAAALGRAIGVPDIVTFDMGGTSADFSLVVGGAPHRSVERTIDGQPLRVPMLDIETISAGRRARSPPSIAAGSLSVGPESAGSDPGPACYGNGGDKPHPH